MTTAPVSFPGSPATDAYVAAARSELAVAKHYREDANGAQPQWYAERREDDPDHERLRSVAKVSGAAYSAMISSAKRPARSNCAMRAKAGRV